MATATKKIELVNQPRNAASAERLLSLDVFRGLTIAGMILVNNAGDWSHVYAPLRHADWHGWTPTDLIFPFFLFIVGVAITYSFSKERVLGSSSKKLLIKVVRRSAIIFALGLLLNGFPYFTWSTLRIPGVLQRIAICYLIAALVYLKTGVKGQSITAVALLIIYGLLMKLVPVPGYGTGILEKDGNLAAYIDNLLMHGHLYKPTWDPEGLLSTIPAIATVLFGILTGHWLRSVRTPSEKISGFFIAGLLGILAGLALSPWFPINKNLWTSSYTLFTAGLAVYLLAACYWVVDVKRYHRGTLPFLIFGRNAIALYVLSGLMGRVITVFKFASLNGKKVSLKAYLYHHFYASWTSPMVASLLWASVYVLIWLGIMSLFYRKKIFIKV